MDWLNALREFMDNLVTAPVFIIASAPEETEYVVLRQYDSLEHQYLPMTTQYVQLEIAAPTYEAAVELKNSCLYVLDCELPAFLARRKVMKHSFRQEPFCVGFTETNVCVFKGNMQLVLLREED